MQKNFKKLKIVNNKIIIEQGSEYGSLGVTAAKTIAKGVGDAVQQTINLVKTNWGLTFGYIWKLGWNLYYEGPAGLKTTNQWFLENNRRNIEEMERLNKQQPGAADMAMFTALTCPAALGFEKIVSKIQATSSKTKYSRTRRWGKSDQDKKTKKLKAILAKIQYHNIVIAISHISHNTGIQELTKNIEVSSNSNSSSGEDDIKYFKNTEAIKNSKTNDFVLICSALKRSLSLKSSQKQQLGLSIQVKPELDNLLNALISKKDEDEIAGFILDKDLQATVSRFCLNVIEEKNVDGIKELNKMLINKVESYSLKLQKVLSIKNSNLSIITEEVEDEESDDADSQNLSKDEFYIYHDSFKLNHIKWCMGSSLLMLNNADNTLKIAKMTLELKHAFLSSLETDNLDNTKLLAVFSNINALSSKIKLDNTKNKKFNKNNDGKVPSIKTKNLTTYLSKYQKDFEKIKSEFEKADSEEKKELIRNSSSLIVIIELAKKIKDINYKSTYENEVEESLKPYIYTTEKVFKNNSELLEEYAEILSSLDIDKSKYTTVCEGIASSINSTKEELVILENALKEFTNKENDLISKVESLSSNVEQTDEDADAEKASSGLDVKTV